VINLITVKTLGKFTVINGDKIVTGDDLSSPQIIKMFICLALHRDDPYSREELKDAIWEDEDIDNSFGALKNMICRTRKKVSDKVDAPFILLEKGKYVWNNELEVEFDFERFDDYILTTINEKDEEIKYLKLERAVELYNGDFIHEVKDGHWVKVLQNYYHKMYVSTVKSLVRHYKQESDYEKIESICDKAITIEKYDQQLYCDLIRAKIKLDKSVEALYLFKRAKRIMERKMGKGNAILMNIVNREICELTNGTDLSNIRLIQNEIAEAETDGVFFCRYSLFKEICNLELRKSRRSEENHNLALLTVQLEKDIPGDVKKERFERSMYGLEHTIRECLRSGDVAAKYSDTQYILLLSQCTKDEAMGIVNRVLESFYESYKFFWRINVKIELDEINMDF